MHTIGFREGYHLMRRVKCDRFTSAFMAFVWALRGDKIPD